PNLVAFSPTTLVLFSLTITWFVPIPNLHSFPTRRSSDLGGYGGFGRKAFIPSRGRVPQTWWANSEVGHNRSAKNELKKLFPGVTPFTTPKPERLLERILHIATKPGDIVLDVFAGSGTTAAVAQKMGRRWVTCELLQDTVDRFAQPR